MKKVLIITYYWPPSGGSGVQRWLKFVKYLPSSGWEPIVFTPENPSFALKDASLLRDVDPALEVIRFPIWEPYEIFQRLSSFGGKPVKQTDYVSTGKKSLFQRFAAFVRGNFFIPDARRFWIKPSVEFLSGILQRNEIATVITTGPPHSVHLIGRELKRLHPELRWVADFRDPWSEWDLLDTLWLTRWARRRHQRMERSVLQEADRVITIAPYHVDRLKALSGRAVDLITNGFDESDFSTLVHRRTEKFTIRHMGVVDELRDPRPFMAAYKLAIQQRPALATRGRVEFVGQVNTAFVTAIQSDPVLQPVTGFVPQVPHQSLPEWYGTTDVQLLVLAYSAIAPGNLPGKFFEYLATQNPILCIGPEAGDAAAIIRASQLGVVAERDNIAAIADAIVNWFDRWERGESLTLQAGDGAKYSRRALTGQLTELLNGLP